MMQPLPPLPAFKDEHCFAHAAASAASCQIELLCLSALQNLLLIVVYPGCNPCRSAAVVQVATSNKLVKSIELVSDGLVTIVTVLFQFA